jgi:hypothetical protein
MATRFLFMTNHIQVVSKRRMKMKMKVFKFIGNNQKSELFRYIRITCSSILLLSTTSAYAAPSISNITGTVSTGQSVTVSGSGFGTKAMAPPVIFDTVDNQSSYSGLSNGASVPYGGSYPWGDNTDGTGNMLFSTTEGRNGSKCYKGLNTSWKATVGNVTFSNPSQQIYASWWWKTDTAAYNSSISQSSKFIRLGSSTDISNLTFSWTEEAAYVYSTNGGGYGSQTGNLWASWLGKVNSWDFYEVSIDWANKTYTLKINNQVSKQQSWSGITPFNFDYIWKIGWDGGGTNPIFLTSWLDDIYVDRTFSRVMIGNASTYSACTHFEMQPPTTWNANGQSITANVNQGSFANGTTAYLYVVDSAGTASNGQQITFGSGTTTTLPAAPTNLILK